MRKHLAALCAILLIPGAGMALDLQLNIGDSTSSYAAQSAMGAFNDSVRDRLETVRVGDLFLTGFSSRGRYAGIASDNAYGAAPSTRAASRSAYGYDGQVRRQLECVYNSGFTVWGDVYGSWEREKAKSGDMGYKYRVGGPAIGFDYTTGGFTVGAAVTHSWGTIKNVGGRTFSNTPDLVVGNGRDKNNRDTRTLALMAYGQYNARRWYVNATLGYGSTKYKSSVGLNGAYSYLGGARQGSYAFDVSDRYRSRSWNADVEFGMKFRFGRGFLLSPSVGLQYFHDRRAGVNQTGSLSYLRTDNGTGSYAVSLDSGSRSYYALELPIGVTFAYEIAAGSALIVPQLRFAWIPELTRKRGSADGSGWALENGWVGAADAFTYSDDAARRSRNAFQVGLGVQAKLNQYLSLHLDYDLTLRSKYYNHNLNLGLGVTF